MLIVGLLTRQPNVRELIIETDKWSLLTNIIISECDDTLDWPDHPTVKHHNLGFSLGGGELDWALSPHMANIINKQVARQ